MRGVALLLHFLVPMFIERQLISCFLVLIYFTYMQNSTDHKLNFWHSVLWIFFFFFPFCCMLIFFHFYFLLYVSSGFRNPKKDPSATGSRGWQNIGF